MLSILGLVGLGIFLVLFIGRSVQMGLAGQNPFTLGKGKAWTTALREILLLPALLFWLYETAAGLGLGWPSLLPGFLAQPLFSETWTDLLGLVILYPGLGLFLTALVHFGGSWRVGIDQDRPGDLVTTGIFSLTRNPIFLFMDLFFLAYALLVGSLFSLTFAALAVVLIHLQIREEEAFLLGKYGESYRLYKARTPRYLVI